MMNPQATEKKAANLLLQRGVKVQVAAPLFLKWFGKKNINVVIKQPLTKTLLRIARKYLEMGISNTGEMDLTEAFTLYAQHCNKMSEIIALSASGSWYYKFLAYLLRGSLTQQEMSYLYHIIIVYGGIEDFINTIRSAEATRITKPMNLSPEEKTS